MDEWMDVKVLTLPFTEKNNNNTQLSRNNIWVLWHIRADPLNIQSFVLHFNGSHMRPEPEFRFIFLFENNQKANSMITEDDDDDDDGIYHCLDQSLEVLRSALKWNQTYFFKESIN